MSTPLDELYERIAPEIKSKPADEITRIVEQYPGVLERTVFPDGEALRRTTFLAANYGLVLTEAGRYREALPVIARALRLMERGGLQQDARQAQLYEGLIYSRGVAASYAGRLKTAGKDFAALSARFPERDNYRVWLDHVRRRKSSRRIDAAMWVSIALLWSGIMLLGMSHAADRHAHTAAEAMIAAGGAAYLPLYLLRQKKRKSAKKT